MLPSRRGHKRTMKDNNSSNQTNKASLCLSLIQKKKEISSLFSWADTCPKLSPHVKQRGSKNLSPSHIITTLWQKEYKRTRTSFANHRAISIWRLEDHHDSFSDCHHRHAHLHLNATEGRKVSPLPSIRIHQRQCNYGPFDSPY